MAQFSRYSTYIEPILKTPKSKAYGMMILSLFAIAFFGIFAIRPTVLTIISLQSEIREDEKIDKQLGQKINSLTRAQDILDQNASKQYLLKEALPPTANVTALLSAIEKRAQDARVTIGNIQVRSITLSGEEKRSQSTFSSTLAAQTNLETQEQTPPSGTAPTHSTGLTEIKFLFTATGSYEALINFVNRLNTTRRIITVDGIHITAKEGAVTSIAEISAKAYQLN